IPHIVLPHTLNIGALGIATSGAMVSEGRTWRTHATVAGFGLAAAEIVLLYSYNLNANTRVYKTTEIDWFHWRLRLYRGLGIAVVDATLGYLVYLTATKQFGNDG